MGISLADLICGGWALFLLDRCWDRASPPSRIGDECDLSELLRVRAMRCCFPWVLYDSGVVGIGRRGEVDVDRDAEERECFEEQ